MAEALLPATETPDVKEGQLYMRDAKDNNGFQDRRVVLSKPYLYCYDKENNRQKINLKSCAATKDGGKQSHRATSQPNEANKPPERRQRKSHTAAREALGGI